MTRRFSVQAYFYIDAESAEQAQEIWDGASERAEQDARVIFSGSVMDRDDGGGPDVSKRPPTGAGFITIGAWSLEGLWDQIRGRRVVDGPFHRSLPAGPHGDERIQHYAYVEAPEAA